MGWGEVSFEFVGSYKKQSCWNGAVRSVEKWARSVYGVLWGKVIMYFIGIDLGWKDKKTTGICVLDENLKN